jgi:hypothetical protein
MSRVLIFPDRTIALVDDVEPKQRREPFTIERYPVVAGSVLLVGYDQAGDVMAEVRVPAARFSMATVDSLRSWLKANAFTRPAAMQ